MKDIVDGGPPVEYLTTVEIAQRLRVHIRSVNRWCKSGQLPAIRVGRQWRIAPADLAAFIKSNRAEEVSPGKADRLALAS